MVLLKEYLKKSKIEKYLQTTKNHEKFPSMQRVILPFIITADILAKKKTVRKVPKGTSEYQASWIIDSDHEEVGINIMFQGNPVTPQAIFRS